MKLLVLLVFLSTNLSAFAAEELPSNMSREPNCIEGTHCIKKDAIVIPSTVPEGFSREPACLELTICVPEHLYMLHEDFIAIRKVVESSTGFGTLKLHIVKMDEVMHGIFHVSAVTENYRPPNDGGGSEFLVEKQGGKWVIIREQTWII